MITYYITEILCHIVLLNPEGPDTAMLKIIVEQQLI